MILTRYQPDEFDRWLKANLPDLVRPENPLGLYNEDGCTVVDHSLWPPVANGGKPPTIEEVAGFNPFTDVEKSTTNFLTAEELATKYLNALKGQVVVYLKTKRSSDEAVAAGVAFVDPDTGIGKEYDYFIKAGGHPLAAAKLYQRIQDVKGSFDWFDDQVNAIFTAALSKS